MNINYQNNPDSNQPPNSDISKEEKKKLSKFDTRYYEQFFDVTST